MLFDRLDVDDGAHWRAALRDAVEPDALGNATRQAQAALVAGADAVDVAACVWAAALRCGDHAAARAAGRVFVALHTRQAPSLALARQLFAAGVDAVSCDAAPCTGPLVRALEATLRAVDVDAFDDAFVDAFEAPWAARYLVARLRVRAAGGPRAPEALVDALVWSVVSRRLHEGAGPHRGVVSSLVQRCLRRADFDDCANVDRVHKLARWLDALGPPPNRRWARFTSDDAAPLLRRVLAHWQQHDCARNELGTSIVLTDLAAIVRARDPAAAEDLYRNSLVVARQVEGDGLQVQVTEAHLAGLLVDVGRCDEAVAILRGLLPRRVALLGPDSEGVYVSTVRLAEALLRLGQLDDAERAARDAVSVSQRARLFSVEARDVLADVLAARGDVDDADVWRDWSAARDAFGLTS